METEHDRPIACIIANDDAIGADVRRRLEEGGDLVGVTIPPDRWSPSIARIAGDHRTGIVVIDRRAAGDRASVEIATSLRSLRPDLPIALLTASADDLGDAAALFDFVIDPAPIGETWSVHHARIMRSIHRYGQAMSETARRRRTLADREIAGELTPAEARELDDLRSDIERPFAFSIAEAERAQSARLAAQEERIARLDEIVARLKRIESAESPHMARAGA